MRNPQFRPGWLQDQVAKSVAALGRIPRGYGGTATGDQTLPRRGDAVEAWIKRRRDEQHIADGNGVDWWVLDDLLDDYRLHADTEIPLDEDVAVPSAEHEGSVTRPSATGGQP